MNTRASNLNSTEATTWVVDALQDEKVKSVHFFATEYREFKDSQRQILDTNSPILVVKVNYWDGSVKLLDEELLTAARDHRKREILQILEVAKSSNKVFYHVGNIINTENLSFEEADVYLSRLNIEPLDTRKLLALLT
ncbi:hypothetical protein [Acinetobacter baumannii]|uniref:hypothetical protein n=1 Tax=Acinetobacter baumannii TaxID=470 RepID=UPI0026525829|nr:hypothetical protein [Acinetobacter baumannii]